MNRGRIGSLLLPSLLLSGGLPAHAGCPADFPERPVITDHAEQVAIAGGRYSFRDLFRIGEELFIAKFNKCDGQGRPATTGAGEKRAAAPHYFLRTSAPDANSCAGCHNDPVTGGGGDVVANVFVLAQALDPVTESVSPLFSNERNTLGMHGSGAIEMLAREMTRELQAQVAMLGDGVHVLNSKGVEFEIRIQAGHVVESKGIDRNLVVKPFHQAGVVVSLREFSVNAMNHHHGMQAEERFDLNPAKGFDPDFDEDGVASELTLGDITALVIYQAALGIPQQVVPRDPSQKAAVLRGERLFADIGCASCHVPEMHLDNPLFFEPNPFNPPGTLADTRQSYAFDLTRDGAFPRLERSRAGGAIVRAYTDLKRHNLCDPAGTQDAIRFLCNEQLDQGRPAQDGRPGREFFITRKLWDAGSSAPYGHRGDLTTLTEAILYHGGEARATRDRFAALPKDAQAALIAFLNSLQVVPTERGVLNDRADSLSAR